jgi:type IV pilus assembly protein PilW
MRANARQSGFTLIELMIAVVLGLLILAALTSFFVRTSYNRSELERNSQQVENGRYAINALRDDFMLAGFYSDVTQPPSTVWNTPPACTTAVGSLGWAPSQLSPQMPVPVFAYPGGVGRPAACTPDYQPGTDVVVVRRFNTEPTLLGQIDALQVYLQVSECSGTPAIPGDNPATPYLINVGSNSGAFILRQRDCATTAPVWRYREQLYYVRSYSTTPGDNIPTLMRVELDSGSANPVPLVEGIQDLKVDFGIDTSAPGDGVVDVWKRCDAATPCSASDYANVMAVKVYVLSRNLDVSREYTDDKIYDMGLAGTNGPNNDHYKRHVYSTLIGMPNRSGPREPAPTS